MIVKFHIASSRHWRAALFGGVCLIPFLSPAQAETLFYDTTPRHEFPWAGAEQKVAALSDNAYENRRAAAKAEKKQKLVGSKKPNGTATPKEKSVEVAQAKPTSLKIVIPNLNAVTQGEMPVPANLAPPQPTATTIAQAPAIAAPPEKDTPTAESSPATPTASSEPAPEEAIFSFRDIFGGLFAQNTSATPDTVTAEPSAPNEEIATQTPAPTPHKEPEPQGIKVPAEKAMASMFGDRQKFAQSSPDAILMSQPSSAPAVSLKQLADKPAQPSDTMVVAVSATDHALVSKPSSPALKDEPSWLEKLISKEESPPSSPKKIEVVVEDGAPVPPPVPPKDTDLATLLADSQTLEAPVSGAAPAAPVTLITPPTKNAVSKAEKKVASAAKPKKEKPGPVTIVKKAELKLASAEAVILPDPLELAKLSPAAGEPAMDENTPLIQLPAPGAPTPLPAPAEAKKEEPKPPAEAVVPLLDQSLNAEPNADKNIKENAEAAVPMPNAPVAQAAPEPQANASKVDVGELFDDTGSPSITASSQAPDMLPVIATPEAPTPVPAPTKAPEPETVAATSEPFMDLSPESKKIAKKIPSNLDKKTQSSDKLNIDRAKDVQEKLNPEASQEISVKHEAMGIKIEVKNQKSNLNYELEKAYNAILTGHTESAIEIYKMVLANDSKNKNALFGLATTYHRAGQLDLAREFYGKLLAIDPQNRDGLNNFLVLLADEAPEAALEQMAILEKRNPDFSPIPAQRAVIYQKLGDTEKASEAMFKAIALAPENLTYRYNLAIMLDKQKKYDEAAKLYMQLITAYQRGEVIPGNPQKIQERLTFIRSNRP